MTGSPERLTRPPGRPGHQAPTTHDLRRQASRAALSPVEAVVAKIFADVLGVSVATADSDFFDPGATPCG